MRFYWNECVSHLINTRNNNLSSTRRHTQTHIHNQREPISFQIRINYMPVTFFGRAPTSHCASGNMLGISILTRTRRRANEQQPQQQNNNNYYSSTLYTASTYVCRILTYTCPIPARQLALALAHLHMQTHARARVRRYARLLERAASAAAASSRSPPILMCAFSLPVAIRAPTSRVRHAYEHTRLHSSSHNRPSSVVSRVLSVSRAPGANLDEICLRIRFVLIRELPARPTPDTYAERYPHSTHTQTTVAACNGLA